jgi:antitoxin component HigA of HigAB toxin-antitoxin module
VFAIACAESEAMKTQHEVLMEDPEFQRLLSVEALVAKASEAIAKLMAEQNVSKADLARRLNKSRAWVTQLLSGKANMTVRTLAEVVYALDADVKLHTQPPSWMPSCGGGFQREG